MNNFENTISFDRKLKRVVKKDWQALLPDMAPLKGYGGCLFKIYGPLVIIHGLKYGGESWYYTTEFAIFNLMYNCDFVIPSNLHTDLVSFGINNEGKKLYNISPKDHKKFYVAAFDANNAATYGFLETRQFSLQEVIAIFKSFIEKKHGKNIGEELVTLPLLAAWGGDINQARELLKWSIEQSTKLYGNFAGYNSGLGWEYNVAKLIEDPEILRETVNTAKLKLNLLSLPCYDLE